jgi:phosphoglycerate dehydrogenase-like enzyme
VPDRSTVVILIPASRRADILSPRAEAQLASVAHVVEPKAADLVASALPRLLDGAVACLTGWGTPPLDDYLLRSHPNLQLVAHTAGSIRRLVPVEAMVRGVRVSHAAAVIADAVAEFVLAQALLCVRQLHAMDAAMRCGDEWFAIRQRFPGRLLGNMTVGIVGTGRVGRAVIRQFRALGCTVLASDPYLTQDGAEQMGVERVDLDSLLSRAEVVSLHAPVLDSTRGLIGAGQLARLRDGAIFINSARAALVDEPALLGEIERGRIVAALDVFEHEPLPPDSQIRSLPGVVLSPHAAGHTIDTHLRQGQAMVDEVEHFLRGEPLQFEITAEMLPIIA